MQIPKIIIPKDTILLSQQMLPPFNIATIAKRRFQIIRTTLNSTKNAAQTLVAFRHSGALLAKQRGKTLRLAEKESALKQARKIKKKAKEEKQNA